MTTLAVTVTLSVLTGAGISSAQEMEHGRTRPASRELQSNQVKSQQAVANSLIGNVRG
jgi:hypothetical protein